MAPILWFISSLRMVVPEHEDACRRSSDPSKPLESFITALGWERSWPNQTNEDYWGPFWALTEFCVELVGTVEPHESSAGSSKGAYHLILESCYSRTGDEA